MPPVNFILILFLTAMPMAAEMRSWRSADGNKSVDGLYLKHDQAGVTIRRADQRDVTIPMDKLHQDDRTWLDRHHPLPGNEPPAASWVFDKLEFGDTRAEVTGKLMSSKLVEATLPETLIARTGLNGVFKTRRKIGGLDASLFFDWSEQGGLKEITLQTTSLGVEDFQDRLLPCWKELIELLTSIHGKPINASGKLDLAPIPIGGMSATHLWKLEQRGTAMLGAARDDDGYQIAVRFTTENIKPVVIPAPSPANR
jgi:hypothetical protein